MTAVFPLELDFVLSLWERGKPVYAITLIPPPDGAMRPVV